MAEPVLVSIASALATRAFARLHDLVRARLAGDPEASAALAAARGADAGSPAVAALGEVLENTERQDPAFGRELRREWERASATGTGGVVNQVTAPVHGTVVQAGDIQGGVTFR
ncbi:hypothetical protein [Saccharothrix coeruleofusca]|uniref:Uncharacterized protein n=1 Tax=Saccharothrix coeruleofusca TaxID=33919 RepID=A0A918EBW1_9PSEU|nr:hypothetical protein [Saccharothrix coeruleofusca]GGP43882.1 hypothetical protein GCM10010185_14470 [Saccharothrix coeruleofusca]